MYKVAFTFIDHWLLNYSINLPGAHTFSKLCLPLVQTSFSTTSTLGGGEPWISPLQSVPSRTLDERQRTVEEGTSWRIRQPPAIPETGLHL